MHDVFLMSKSMGYRRSEIVASYTNIIEDSLGKSRQGDKVEYMLQIAFLWGLHWMVADDLKPTDTPMDFLHGYLLLCQRLFAGSLFNLLRPALNLLCRCNRLLCSSSILDFFEGLYCHPQFRQCLSPDKTNAVGRGFR